MGFPKRIACDKETNVRQAGIAPTRGIRLCGAPHRFPKPARLLVSPLPLWWRRAGHVRPLRSRRGRSLAAPSTVPPSRWLPTATAHGPDAAGIQNQTSSSEGSSSRWLGFGAMSGSYQRPSTTTILPAFFKRCSAVRTVLSGNRQTVLLKLSAISTPRLPGFSWINWCTSPFAVGVNIGGDVVAVASSSAVGTLSANAACMLSDARFLTCSMAASQPLSQPVCQPRKLS